MPFQSKAQWRLCYAARRRGSDWDCEEWGRGQKYASLPERVGSRSKSKSRSKIQRKTKRSKSRSKTHNKTKRSKSRIKTRSKKTKRSKSRK